MLVEESPQMTTADTDTRCERIDVAAPVAIVAIVESAFRNEIERPPDRVRSTSPSCETGSDFGAAPEARSEPGGVRRRRAPINVQVSKFGVLAGHVGRQKIPVLTTTL